LICDRIGRKVALVSTTLLTVLGCVDSWLWLKHTQLSFCCSATLGTAAHGAHGSIQGLFWFLTVARGITGVVSGRHGRMVHIENRPLSRAWEENILHHRQALARLLTKGRLSIVDPVRTTA
jgi:hypothetical protein